MNQPRTLVSVFLYILFLLLIVGLVWGNYHFTQSDNFAEGFSIQWIGIGSLVTNGNSPYSDIVTTKIHDSVQEGFSFTGANPPKYTSPLYSGVVVFPFTIISNKTLAHALWLTAQLVAVFIIIILCLRLTGWKPAWYIFLLFLLFTIFSYHVLIPWLDGGLSIWAALFLVLAFLAILSNRNEVGGILLALATIQPQMVILLVIFILIWSGYQRRKSLILWFFITVVFLSIVGLFLAPDWILQYIRILYNYAQNFPPGSPGYLFSTSWSGVGKQLGWLFTGVSSLILIVEWWLAIRKDYRWFLWTACLTLVISQWIGIPTIPANFVGLILPMILLFAMLTERWPRSGQWAAVLITIIVFAWEWAIFYLDLTSTQPKMQINLIFPLPLILLIGLYWVRWWAIKPRRMLMEELRLSETY